VIRVRFDCSWTVTNPDRSRLASLEAHGDCPTSVKNLSTRVRLIPSTYCTVTTMRRRFPLHRVSSFLLLRAITIVFTWAVLATSAFAEKGYPANLVKWRTGLTSSAQPDANYLARGKSLGYEMVINLAPPQSQGSLEQEAGMLGRQGLVYVNIPVNFAEPTAEDFRLFSEMMKLAAKKQVLVHCQVNLRASSFTFLYRVIHEGAVIEEAQEKLLSVWSPDPTWKKFIESILAAHGKKVELL
jgi:protein tyrosine phosphatase (PTP) superfamily phosphohydrolase (DUF442 family)